MVVTVLTVLTTEEVSTVNSVCLTTTLINAQIVVLHVTVMKLGQKIYSAMKMGSVCVNREWRVSAVNVVKIITMI